MEKINKLQSFIEKYFKEYSILEHTKDYKYVVISIPDLDIQKEIASDMFIADLALSGYNSWKISYGHRTAPDFERYGVSIKKVRTYEDTITLEVKE